MLTTKSLSCFCKLGTTSIDQDGKKERGGWVKFMISNSLKKNDNYLRRQGVKISCQAYLVSSILTMINNVVPA